MQSKIVLFDRLKWPHQTRVKCPHQTHIIKILLIGATSLTGLTLLVRLGNLQAVTLAVEQSSFTPSLLLHSLFFISLFSLYLAVKQGQSTIAIYLFIALLWVFTSYMVIRWGALFPQAIINYILIATFTGLTLSLVTAAAISVLTSIFLGVVTWLHLQGVVPYIHNWLPHTYTYSTVASICLTLSFTVVVSWLYHHSHHQLEHQQHQAHSLHFAEMGRLTAELLHNIRNPLTAALLNIDHLQQYPENKRSYSTSCEVRKNLEYITQLIEAHQRQIQHTTRSQYFSPMKETQLAVQMMQIQAKQHAITLRPSLNPTPQLYGCPVKFNQIVAQLISNAIDSYNSQLMHSTSNHQVVIQLTDERNYIKLIIKDWGCGISPVVQPHIFDVLFTTKPANQGTGLGLAIVKENVESFNGSIEYASAPGSGTNFVVTIPTPQVIV